MIWAFPSSQVSVYSIRAPYDSEQTARQLQLYPLFSGSVEIPNLTYANDLNDPKSQKFLLQAEAIQNYLAETYVFLLVKVLLEVCILVAFSEGESGLQAYY